MEHKTKEEFIQRMARFQYLMANHLYYFYRLAPDDIDVGVRAYNCLCSAGAITTAQFFLMSTEDLEGFSSIPMIGKKTVKELKDAHNEFWTKKGILPVKYYMDLKRAEWVMSFFC